MRKIKLMVVDDEAMVRSFIKQVIIRDQLPIDLVIEADNGLEAVNLAKKHSPHLVLMDIRIPEMDGIRAAERILQIQPAPQVVIISAYDDFEYARGAFRIGVSDYLVKPVRPAEIASIIRKVAGIQSDASIMNPQSHSKLEEQVKEYIHAHLEEQFQLKDLAKEVYISPFHLSRTFKQITGMSLTSYILKIRIAAAERLLVSTSLSITEIANKVGFNDAAYFSTKFRQINKVTPSIYRNEQKNKGIEQ